MRMKYFGDASAEIVNAKLYALDAVQGVRSLPIDLEVYRSKKHKQSRKESDRKELKKLARISSVSFADSLAHDLIDELLTRSGNDDEVTTSRFVLMHNCDKNSQSKIPFVDDVSIKAPCCLSDLYQFPQQKIHPGQIYSGGTASLETCVSKNVETFENASNCKRSHVSTSTPKHKQEASDKSRRSTFDSPCSTASSQAAEHHETPLGVKRSLHRQREFNVNGSSKNMNRKNFTHSELDDSLDFRYSLDDNDLAYHRSYDESLFVNTNFNEIVSILAVKSSTKRDQELKQSTESVIRHPSYFSDSDSSSKAGIAFSDQIACSSNVGSLSSVFAADLVMEPKNSRRNSVETQTDESFLAKQVEEALKKPQDQSFQR